MDQAEAISEGRSRGGWTLESLAAAAGVSSRTVLRAKQGARVKPDSLRRICRVLDLDPEQLVPDPAADEKPAAESEPLAPVPPVEAADGPPAGAALRAFLSQLPAAVGVSALFLLAMGIGNALFVSAVTTKTPTLQLAEEAAAVRAVARYANALAGGADSAKPLPGYVVERCEPEGGILSRILWTVAPTCRTESLRIERSAGAGGSVEIVAGPVGRDFGGHVLRRLSFDPAVRWEAAFGSGPASRSLAWFDPRAVAAAELPRPPGEASATWLNVRMVPTPTKSASR